MPHYYVNDTAQSNGDHEVHTAECAHKLKVKYYTTLGSHTSCRSAVERAKRIYPTADGCKICSPECNTS
jgi:hypothetical protein